METLGRPLILWRDRCAHRVRRDFCGESAARTTFHGFIGVRWCSAMLGRLSRNALADGGPSKPGALTRDPAAGEKWANTCRSVGFRRRPTAARSRFRSNTAIRSCRRFVSCPCAIICNLTASLSRRNREGGLSASDITIYLALIFGANHNERDRSAPQSGCKVFNEN